MWMWMKRGRYLCFCRFFMGNVIGNSARRNKTFFLKIVFVFSGSLHGVPSRIVVSTMWTHKGVRAQRL